MRFERIQYLDWARRQFDERPPKYNLAASGMASASMADAGIDPAALTVAGSNAFGHAGIRKKLSEFYGVTSDRVLVATGTTGANFLVSASVLREGDTALCEWPAYEPLWRTLESVGARVQYFDRAEESDFMPDVSAIADGFAKGAKLCVLSNLHNPSAALIDTEVLREIGRLAERFDAWVHVDEVYLESVFSQHVTSAVQLSDRFIVTSSLTKTHGLGGLRAGWAIGPRWMVERANDVYAYMAGNAPLIADTAIAQALDHLPRLRERAQQRHADNWPNVKQFAEERGLLTATPAGAFIIWLRLPQGLDADHFSEHLRTKHETLVVPGTFFGRRDRFRLSFSGDPAMVSDGLRRVGLGLDELASNSAG